MPADPSQGRFASLARHLETLASEPRLELLHNLRTPQALGEMRVGAGLSREDENPERPLSRQAVARHIELLQDNGLVKRVTKPGGARGDAFVLNHERLFALVDELRGLAKLRPVLSEPAPLDATIARGEALSSHLPARPRMLVAYGRDDGVAFGLDGAEGTKWRIGRGPTCEIRLDYDPYLSTEHAILERRVDQFLLTDGQSRNGTRVNWEPLQSGGSRTLSAGDLVVAGRSVLAFQP